MSPDDVLNFWFHELTSADWFKNDASLDQLIKDRYRQLHTEARQGELLGWRINMEGRLAEIIVLDQFSRNIFRDQTEAFTYDPLSLVLAQEAVATNEANKLDPSHRAFLYMPYMHSESRAIHKLAVRLFSEPGMENNLDFETKHKIIIDRFGRYPHRNEILGRVSTQEEIQFLTTAGSSF